MEETIAFAATVVLISISGVMSPGPLFATNIVYGIRGGLSATCPSLVPVAASPFAVLPAG